MAHYGFIGVLFLPLMILSFIIFYIPLWGICQAIFFTHKQIPVTIAVTGIFSGAVGGI